MSINFAGHNVKLQLTHLDADTESPAGGIPVGTLAQAAANLTLKQQALLKDVVGNGGGATAAPA